MSPSRPQRKRSTDHPRDIEPEPEVRVSIRHEAKAEMVVTMVRVPFAIYNEIKRYAIPGTSMLVDDDE